MVLLKTCCYTRNAMEHFLRQCFFVFTKFSVFWNQTYNSLKSYLTHPLHCIRSWRKQYISCLFYWKQYAPCLGTFHLIFCERNFCCVARSLKLSTNFSIAWTFMFGVLNLSEPCFGYILKLYAAFNFDFKEPKEKIQTYSEIKSLIITDMTEIPSRKKIFSRLLLFSSCCFHYISLVHC